MLCEEMNVPRSANIKSPLGPRIVMIYGHGNACTVDGIQKGLKMLGINIKVPHEDAGFWWESVMRTQRRTD
jgi:hypothetical protein